MVNRLRFSWSALPVLALAVITLLFFIFPILALIIRAIEAEAWTKFNSEAIADALALSTITTLICILITLVFGTALAYALVKYQFPLKRIISVFIELPIVLPPAVAGLGLLILYGRNGFLGQALGSMGITITSTTTAVILAQVFVAAPFYVRAAQIGFRSIPKSIEEAAFVDGASRLTSFWYITLPLAAPTLAAGLVLTWARAVGEFGATALFAGSLQGHTQTMPLLIYNIFGRDIDAAIWTGILLIIFAFFALLCSQWLARLAARDRDFETVAELE